MVHHRSCTVIGGGGEERLCPFSGFVLWQRFAEEGRVVTEADVKAIFQRIGDDSKRQRRG